MPSLIVQKHAARRLHDDFRPEVDGALGNEQLRTLIESIERQATERQTVGVPFFIVDRKCAVSGAQPTEQWVEALQKRHGG